MEIIKEKLGSINEFIIDLSDIAMKYPVILPKISEDVIFFYDNEI